VKLVIQRVSSARVGVDTRVVGSIEAGLMVLAGLVEGDAEADLTWAAEKLANLRIFEDEQGKMNRSVLDTRGGILLVPNFTLAGEAVKGRRPSFDRAMKPEVAGPMFARLAELLRAAGVPTQTGVFRAHMVVTLVNDGPVTILLDTAERAR